MEIRPRGRVCGGGRGGGMGIAISQVLASLGPYFFMRSIVRMALRRLTEKNIPLVMNLTEKGYNYTMLFFGCDSFQTR